MGSTDVSELGGSELGQVGVDVESEDGILSACPLQRRDLGLQFVLRYVSLLAGAVVSGGAWPLLLLLLLLGMLRVRMLCL